MKKKFLILPAIALLASCGGGQQQKQTTQNEDTTQKVVATEPQQKEVLEEDDDEDELAGLPEAFFKFVEKLPKSPNKQVYFQDESEDIVDGYAVANEFCFAFPIKSGGYLTIYQQATLNNDFQANHWCGTFLYKNNELHSIHKVLPIPDKSYLIDKNIESNQTADAKGLTELVNKNPYNFVYYVFSQDEPIVRAGFHSPFAECEGWKESFADVIRYDYDLPTFKWDGERFVSYDALTEFTKTLPAKPDKPFYRADNEYDIHILFCYVSNTYYALPMNDGGYMVLWAHTTGSESSSEGNYVTYIYKNGKITSKNNILPVPETKEFLDQDKCKNNMTKAQEIENQYKESPEMYLSYTLTDEGKLNVSIKDNGCEQWGEDDLEYIQDVVFKWDGEKFVKE